MATVNIKRASDVDSATLQVAKQTWYANAAGEPTTDANEAAQRLTIKDSPILPHVAVKYGFVDGDLKAAENAEVKSEGVKTDPKPTESKRGRGASENKSK